MLDRKHERCEQGIPNRSRVRAVLCTVKQKVNVLPMRGGGIATMMSLEFLESTEAETCKGGFGLTEDRHSNIFFDGCYVRPLCFIPSFSSASSAQVLEYFCLALPFLQERPKREDCPTLPELMTGLLYDRLSIS